MYVWKYIFPKNHNFVKKILINRKKQAQVLVLTILNVHNWRQSYFVQGKNNHWFQVTKCTIKYYQTKIFRPLMNKIRFASLFSNGGEVSNQLILVRYMCNVKGLFAVLEIVQCKIYFNQTRILIYRPEVKLLMCVNILRK